MHEVTNFDCEVDNLAGSRQLEGHDLTGIHQQTNAFDSDRYLSGNAPPYCNHYQAGQTGEHRAQAEQSIKSDVIQRRT